jgi:hypothetical protein
VTAQTPGQQTAADVEDKITAAVDGLCACGCKQPLPEDGASAYFLGEGHQHAWAMRNAANPREVMGHEGVVHLTLPPEWDHLVDFMRDEMATTMGVPPVWRQMSEGEIQSTYDTMREIESRLNGIPVFVSPLIPDDRIIVASDGTRDGLRTSVAMVKNLGSLTPKPAPAPRRPWWRRLLWWRKA